MAIDEGLTEAQSSRVDQIARSGRQLLGLINELLDLAHLESGRMVLYPEEVDVASVVAEAVAAM